MSRARCSDAAGVGFDPSLSQEVNMSFSKLPKIDIHVHTVLKRGLPRLNGSHFATPDELRSMYDEIGVEMGVLLPAAAPDCYDGAEATNEDVMQIVAERPADFTWFCNIDPRWGRNSPETDLSHYLRYYQAQGARGVGEITANLPFNDPLVHNLFRHAEACGMPLTFHIGRAGGGDYGLIDEPGLPLLEQALQLFPGLTFLGHSQKFWAEIGGYLPSEERVSYPKGPVRPGGRIVTLMRAYPNLCGDLSAGSGSNAVMRDPEFGCAFIEEFQDRLFYGTDICQPENRTNPMLLLSGWLDQMAEEGKISLAAYRKVSRENAVRLLKLA